VVRYRYNQQYTPPAPFVHVTVRCAQTGLEVQEQPAQIDTAADRTVIPLPLVEKLAAIPVRQLPVAGLAGSIFHLSTYLLQLTIRQLPTITLEVLATHDEAHILLGRDALNQFRMRLDGPGLLLDLDG